MVVDQPQMVILAATCPVMEMHKYDMEHVENHIIYLIFSRSYVVGQIVLTCIKMVTDHLQPQLQHQLEPELLSLLQVHLQLAFQFQPLFQLVGNTKVAGSIMRTAALWLTNSLIMPK